jgi:hypothetical protein
MKNSAVILITVHGGGDQTPSDFNYGIHSQVTLCAFGSLEVLQLCYSVLTLDRAMFAVPRQRSQDLCSPCVSKKDVWNQSISRLVGLGLA